MDIRTAFTRIRPWCLKAAALLRICVFAVTARVLLPWGAVGIGIAIWLGLSAVGLWRRRLWAWRVALLGDIAIVMTAAVLLLEAGDLQLFSTIAAVAIVDVVLLGLGQAALEFTLPPPPPA